MSAVQRKARKQAEILQRRVGGAAGADVQASGATVLGSLPYGGAVQLKKAGTVAKAKKKYTVQGSGAKTVFIPTKPNGKTLYFFFGFDGSAKEQKEMKDEAPHIEDDVKNAASSGFKVVYDKGGTKAEFLAALYDGTCYGIYWSAHGDGKGGIWTSDGKVVKPSQVKKSSVSAKLNYLILATCSSAAADWSKSLPSGVQFQGWVNSTYASETKDFTTDDGKDDAKTSHKGTNPNKELDDYISDAAKAK